jgi:ketosteroid isomerase-like protein
MNASILYRTAAVLLVLFALGHQLGFRRVDPAWQADSVVHGMQTVHFSVQGLSRTYWGFFSGFGFFVTAFLLFAALIAWELARLPAETLRQLSRVQWAFAIVFVVIAVTTWAYFFIAPGVFATLVAVCLIAAPLMAGRATTTRGTVERYFDRLERRNGWEASLADNMAFTSFTSPTKQVNGKDAYLQATKRFYSTIAGVTVRDIIVSGDKACALTHYRLQPPNGAPAFESDVAEIFSVKKDKIESFGIYFDTAPFPK